MFGWIMPAPLPMPNSRAPPTSRNAVLGRVSVVMMARAAASQPSGASSPAACRMPAAILSIGSRGPMTPVDITATERGGSPSAVSARPRHRRGVRQPGLARAGIGAARVDGDRAQAGRVLGHQRRDHRAPARPGTRCA